MRKYIKIFLAVFVICLLVFLGYKVWNKITYKNKVLENTENLPVFAYQNVEAGLKFTRQDLNENLPTIFIYFNSECEYCQHEAIDIKENIKKLKNVQILFVSIENPKTIEKFAKNYNLLNCDNIHFLFDNRKTFADTFDVTSIPFILIYDKDKRLVKKIKGQTKIDNILNAFEK